MNDLIRIATVAALAIGLGLSILAVGLWLVRKTQGLKGTVQVKAMAEIACEKIVSVLPSRRTVFVCLVGINAYLTSLALCTIINVISIQWIPREPNTGGDFDGLGDALLGMLTFALNFAFSLAVSFVVAVIFVVSALKQIDVAEKVLHKPAA